jgi:NAD(P)-dependent dehydrogenase (short-subunit alcohol dehydrogenase family)
MSNIEMGEHVSRVAVVTGGGSGVGRAICEHLASEGHRVAVLDIDAVAADAVAASLPTQSLAVQVDVAVHGSVIEAFEKARATLGPIEILVTSAAVSGFVRLDQLDLETWHRTIEVNLSGTFYCVQAAIADMRANGWGRIVTISSAAGQMGTARQVHYSASKGGVIALTKAVALEYAAKGITANTIPPFAVETPMMREMQERKLLPGDEILTSMIPARRLGSVDDIASTCVFLCSDQASFITGQVIAPNGGAVL